MIKDEMFNKGQFLLTTKNSLSISYMKQMKFREYNLYSHPKLSLSESEHIGNGCILLGDVYSWKEPELSNVDICNILVKADSREEIIKLSNDYCGDFVIIADINNEIFIFNDACAQAEIYFSTDYSSFASQTNLLATAVQLLLNPSQEIIDYYKSKEFAKTHLHIRDKTEFENVKHLMPNHYISLSQKTVKRFFPTIKALNLSLKESAESACQMLKGFIKAISLRHKLALGVTAGIDSRVLFLASLGLDVRYYTSQFDFMTLDHYDIKVAQKLTAIYGKKLEIIPEVSAENYKDEEYQTAKAKFENSVDHPRIWYFNKIFNSSKSLANTISINGNISEIARNYFGYLKNIDANALQGLLQLQSVELAKKEYKAWLVELSKQNHNLNQLDLFYWEERMGNWASKAKTESKAHGRGVVSPFNSRLLLLTLLSSKRAQRDSHLSQLYTEMINILSNGKKQVMKLPVNPSKKQFVIKTLKRLKLYNAYQKLRLVLLK